ncbi:hypothetical protein [Nocardia sp. NPDC003345]
MGITSYLGVEKKSSEQDADQAGEQAADGREQIGKEHFSPLSIGSDDAPGRDARTA